MPDSIPDGITTEDVTHALRDLDSGIDHQFAPSTGYDLLFEGRTYPPKAVLGLAARRLAGRQLTPYDFKGGEGSRCFRILRGLGFEIVPKGSADEGQFDLFTTEESGPELFLEGATRQVFVNAYERNPAARKACLEHYGYSCVVCDFNFEAVYGEIGKDFIHVHHLRELASIGEEYEVDPIDDLRPVCPNCHAMLHVDKPALGIDELRARIRREASSIARR